MNTSEPKIVSSDGFTYRAVANWAQWPDDWTVSEVTGVATDSQDRVYVFNRGDHPVAVFDPSGTLLFSWGEGLFHRPHGIWIGPDDAVYCTDDLDHTVHKFTSPRTWLSHRTATGISLMVMAMPGFTGFHRMEN